MTSAVRFQWFNLLVVSSLIKCMFFFVLFLFFYLCFALIWPSRLTGRSLSIVNQRWPLQWGISQSVHPWFDDLSFFMIRPSWLPLSGKKKIKLMARSCELWAVRVCTETKLDEACRWPPRQKAERRSQVLPVTTDTRLSVERWMWAVPRWNLTDLDCILF